MALNGKRKGLKVPADEPTDIRADAVLLKRAVEAVVEAEKIALEAANRLEEAAQFNQLPRFGAAVHQETQVILDLLGPHTNPTEWTSARVGDLLDLIDLASQARAAA